MTSRHEQLYGEVRRFHQEHPEVWRLFERFTLERIRLGFKHYSADAIMHRVRWETSAGSKGDAPAINNNYVAFYARRFMNIHPEHDGFFKTRVQKSRLRSARYPSVALDPEDAA